MYKTNLKNMIRKEYIIYNNNKYYIYEPSRNYRDEKTISYIGISFIFDENNNLKISIIDKGILYESEIINFKNKNEFENLYKYGKYSDPVHKYKEVISVDDVVFYFEIEKYCKKNYYIGEPEIKHEIIILNDVLFLKVLNNDKVIFSDNNEQIGFQINTKLYIKYSEKIDLSNEIKKNNILFIKDKLEFIIENYDDLTKNDILNKLQNIYGEL